MTAYEQMARALVEIAREVKGIRRELESLNKKSAAASEGIRCPWNGAFCTECKGDACEFRAGGVENG